MARASPVGKKQPGVTILLVDDDPLICTLGRELLETLGYQVKVARDGPEALRLYQQARRPDLVILDYYLPGDNGSHILAQLKGLDPKVRVMLASGFLASQEVARLKEQGASGLIYKPFRVQDLEAQIRRILAGPPGS